MSKLIGQRVLLSRRDLDWTQAELADRVGVSRGYISDIERGKEVNIGVDVIFALATSLNVSVPYLLGLSEDPLGAEGGEGRADSREQVVYEVASASERGQLQRLVDLFQGLNQREKEFVLAMMEQVKHLGEPGAFE